jgi:hypothetical protein
LAFLMRDYGRTVRMRPFEKRESSATFWRAILGLGPVSFVGRVWFSRAASLGMQEEREHRAQIIEQDVRV